MNRAEKIQLLKDISLGKKSMSDLLPKSSIFIQDKDSLYTLDGKKYKLDLSDCSFSSTLQTIVILPKNGRENTID